MADTRRIKVKTAILWGVLLGLFCLPFSCQPKEKPFAVGIILQHPIFEQAFDGFKAGMAELGYVEGETIRYVRNHDIADTEEKIDADVAYLLAKHVDLFLTAGVHVTQKTKEALKGSETSIIFMGSTNPVEEGLVASNQIPGGNLTGVRIPIVGAKLLEWLKVIVPGIKTVFLPYNPNDKVSVTSVLNLKAEELERLDIEVIFHPVDTVEEAVAAIEKLPDNVGGILRIPSPTLDLRNSELSRTAIRRGLPMVSILKLDDAVLMVLSADLFSIGEKNARLARLIHNGEKPYYLPVETAEVVMTINLKTAEQIGINIPNEVLLHANTIIR